MRTTITLDEELLEEAQRLTGTQERTALIREGLKVLIERESARRLARLGGTERELCEKGAVVPDFQDADGRGSSRRFSARNLLEFAIALRLRELEIGVAYVGAVVHVLRAFERRVGKEFRDFRLPDSLRVPGAPDLRVVIADGGRLYFTLAAAVKRSILPRCSGSW